VPNLDSFTNFTAFIDDCGGMRVVGHEVKVKVEVEVAAPAASLRRPQEVKRLLNLSLNFNLVY
jgi:hypothetical protein